MNQITNLMKAFPFATLVSKNHEGQPFFSHIPVFSEVVGNEVKVVRGHLALRNPHVGYLQRDSKVTLIFHGPHTYITPNWYRAGKDVPTWNYCVVHVHGQLILQSSFEEICTNLKELTAEFEKGVGAWEFDLPEDLVAPEDLTKAIVAFSIVPEKIEAKFKLGKNRSVEDQIGIVEGLTTRSDDMSRAILELMKHEN